MAADEVPISDWLNAGTSDPGAVAERYDGWATAYDDDLAAWGYRAPTVVTDTVLARHPDATSVLDVGCGTGLVGRLLRDRGFSGVIRGLDISQASLDPARDGGAYDSVEQADLQQRLPLEDDSVDAVVCVGVMTYLPEVEAVWRELARVARPGGVVVVTQRDDLWDDRACQAVVDRLARAGVWTAEDVTGPAPYLPEGYGGGPAVACYYLTARVERGRAHVIA
jgi:predicted TPR repeat methyltransferase